jgi:hypothetical protein
MTSVVASAILGLALGHQADIGRAGELMEAAQARFAHLGDEWGQTMALELLGVLARRRGAYADAITVYEEALGVVRDLGLRDYRRASELHRAALAFYREAGFTAEIAHSLASIGVGGGTQGAAESVN